MSSHRRQFLLWFAFLSILLMGFQFRSPDITTGTESTEGSATEVATETKAEEVRYTGKDYGQIAWEIHEKKIIETCRPPLPDPLLEPVDQAAPESKLTRMMAWLQWAVMGTLTRYVISEATVLLVRPMLRFFVELGTRFLIGFFIRSIRRLRRLRGAFDLDIV